MFAAACSTSPEEDSTEMRLATSALADMACIHLEVWAQSLVPFRRNRVTTLPLIDGGIAEEDRLELACASLVSAARSRENTKARCAAAADIGLSHRLCLSRLTARWTSGLVASTAAVMASGVASSQASNSPSRYANPSDRCLSLILTRSRLPA